MKRKKKDKPIKKPKTVEDLSRLLKRALAAWPSVGTKEMLERAHRYVRKVIKAKEAKTNPPPSAAMPEPVDIWFARDNTADIWQSFDDEAEAKSFVHIIGPHTIIPGLMNPDALFAKGLFIVPMAEDVWRICQYKAGLNPERLAHWFRLRFHTALQAQWAATQLAKEIKA